MTTALIKELLLDASLNKLSFELNADLISAVEKVLLSGVFTDQDIAWFDLYLCGYTAQDIAEWYTTTIDIVTASLNRLFLAIANTSGYTDESFIHRIKSARSITENQLRKIQHILDQQSNNYIEYERV